ncbi:MAG: hypothetical protein V1856_01400, partial [Candidatus Liptonbacteria bacterium]
MDPQAAGKDYRKMMFVFLVMVLLGIGGIFAWEIYKEWTLPQRAAELQREIDQMREQEHQRLMADTYGGKTPQETLGMYIEAVEKGDYELASKYFIEEKQADELRSFNGATEEKLARYIDLLKSAHQAEGTYNHRNDYF